MRKNIILLGLAVFALTSCSKDTEDISKVTVYPEFHMEGESFMNILTEPNGTYADPGIKALKDDVEYPIDIDGSVDITTPGYYPLVYTAYSDEGFPTAVKRHVLVTDYLITADYSGDYIYNSAIRPITLVVPKKVGFYAIADIWKQSTKIPIEFVDLGDEFLVLTHTSVYGPIDVTITADAAGNLTIVGKITGGGNAGASWTSVFTKKK